MFDIDRNGIWICRCCCFCGEFLVFVRFIDRFCGEKREIKRTGNAAIGRWISMQTTLRDLWRSSMSGIVANQRDTWTKKKKAKRRPFFKASRNDNNKKLSFQLWINWNRFRLITSFISKRGTTRFHFAESMTTEWNELKENDINEWINCFKTKRPI